MVIKTGLVRIPIPAVSIGHHLLIPALNLSWITASFQCPESQKQCTLEVRRVHCASCFLLNKAVMNAIEANCSLFKVPSVLSTKNGQICLLYLTDSFSTGINHIIFLMYNNFSAFFCFLICQHQQVPLGVQYHFLYFESHHSYYGCENKCSLIWLFWSKLYVVLKFCGIWN